MSNPSLPQWWLAAEGEEDGLRARGPGVQKDPGVRLGHKQPSLLFSTLALLGPDKEQDRGHGMSVQYPIM